MNQKYHIEFKTPQKPEKNARIHHSHQYSTPLIESLVFQTERNQTLTNRGEQVLKRWDFFSDPFSVPDKYAKNSPLNLKTETSASGNDSIDRLLQQKYFQKPKKDFQPIQKSLSEQNIMNRRQVQFAENVSVRNVDGQIFEKPMKLNNQFSKKSRFSKCKQNIEDSEASYQ